VTETVEPAAPGTSFSTTGSATRVEKPWGYEILWTQPDRPYVGKLLHVEAGKRLSLQVHDAKTESWFLVGGRAKVLWDDGTGMLVETELEPGLGYSCQIGQRHRLVGITDCDIVEVSTPEIGTTHRLEDDYSRPDETDAMRSTPGRGWVPQ
jgi:mannose-6-phosphate isomerase